MIAEKVEKLAKAKKRLMNENIIVFTSDVDWASEYAVESVLKVVKNYNILMTVFLTHPSHVLDAAIKENRVQGGLHPNFTENSSQGDTFEDVIKYCFALYPQAE